MILRSLRQHFLMIVAVVSILTFSPKLTFSKAPEVPANASLSGMVMDSTSKETLIGATVAIVDEKLGSYTNKAGFYSIKNIKPGKYKVRITAVGFATKFIEVNLADGEQLRKDFLVAPMSVTSREVAIYANREEDKRQISISKVNIPVEQIKEIRIGGESDLFRSLQLLPGVLTSSQISSGLYIRGGSPDQNLVLLDGSTVYNPSHLFGFISTFNTDAIKDVELIKGGFPAEYGGRLSAVLNVTQKDGNREEFAGIGSVGFISSKLALEGPVGNGSWFLSGRRTYFDLLKAAVPNDPENPLPDFYFYDLNGKITQDLGENDKIFISGFRSADVLGLSDGKDVSLELGIANQSGSVRWNHIFKDDLFSTLNFTASNYKNNLLGDNSGFEILIENQISDYTLKGALEWFTTEDITSKFGFEVNNFHFDFLQNFTGNADSTSQGSGGGETNLGFQDWHYAAFGQMNFQVTELLSIQAGLRGSYFTLADKYTLDPRLAFRYQLQEDIAVKFSWGIFHQNLKLAAQPDFSFFDTWLGTDSSLNISRAMHYIVSVETQPFDGYSFNVDAYYKPMWNVNELNRFVLEANSAADALYEGNAVAYGFELFLQKQVGDFTGWVGYAFGFVESTFDSINQGRSFNPKYDRRHDFKAVAQWKINNRWEMGANFALQSGQPFTGQTSRFQARFPDRMVGRGITIPSDRFGLRLPMTHQLNMNVSYKFQTFGKDSRVILDVYNVYNRRDIWFRFYNTNEDVTRIQDIRLLPIIPTLSYEIKL